MENTKHERSSRCINSCVRWSLTLSNSNIKNTTSRSVYFPVLETSVLQNFLTIDEFGLFNEFSFSSLSEKSLVSLKENPNLLDSIRIPYQNEDPRFFSGSLPTFETLSENTFVVEFDLNPIVIGYLNKENALVKAKLSVTQ